MAIFIPVLSRCECVQQRYPCTASTCCGIHMCTNMHVTLVSFYLPITHCCICTQVSVARLQTSTVSAHAFLPAFMGGEIVKCCQCSKEKLISMECSLALQTHCHCFYAAHYTMVKFS
jgi:hypothetical protein